jgi:hypothetical protein
VNAVGRRHLLLLSVSVLGTAALLWVLLAGEREVRLVPVAPAPRPPVRADPGTQPLVLSGYLDPSRLAGNALRRRRNELAEAHREALAAWEAGRRPLREAEGLEMLLWAARRQVGEIDERAFHAELAVLFERELERLERLYEEKLAGEDQVARARLYVARERHRAGLPIDDPRGRTYEEMRSAYLAETKARQERLIELGLGYREQFLVDYAQLEREFAPPEPATGG